MKTVLVQSYFLDLGQISHLSKYTSGSDLSVRTRFPYLQLQPSSSHCLPPPHPLGHTSHIRQINLWPLSIFVFFWDLQFAILANKVMTSLCVQVCLFTILQFAILVVFSRYLLDQFHALSLLLLLASQLLLLLYLIHYIIYYINYILYIISISSQAGNIAFEKYNVITHVSKQEILFNTLQMCTCKVREALKNISFSGIIPKPADPPPTPCIGTFRNTIWIFANVRIKMWILGPKTMAIKISQKV